MTLQIQINLLQDNDGVPGDAIANDQITLNDTFFVEIVAGDIRDGAAGINGIELDVQWDPAILESIDSDLSDAVTDNLPFNAGGSLDNDSGLINFLGGGSFPGLGRPIGVNELERFALLRFRGESLTNNAIPLTVTVPRGQISFGDGTGFVAGSEQIEQQTLEVVVDNDPPTLDNQIPDQTASEDQAFSFTFSENTFSDPDTGDQITYSATSEDDSPLPNWLSFDASTRTFSGTPADENIGNLNIKVIATDSQGATVSDTFALSVGNTNDAPTVANEIADQTATEDTAFSFSFPENTFNDVDAGDSLTYSATLEDDSPLPSWLSIDSDTRTFSGTPANDNVGNLNIKVTATDSQGATVSDTFTLTVGNTNDTPTVANEITDQTATEDTAFSFIFPENTFNDVDAGDSLTYSATLEDDSPLPSWLSFDVTNRSFSGTPSNENIGNLDIKVTATDSEGAIVSDTFTLTVKNFNRVPTVANQIADQTTTEDTAFSFSFPENTFDDVDPGDSLTYSATLEDDAPLPSWLSFDSNTRTFSGTPANENVGNLNIKVVATDSEGATVSDTFILNVGNTNDAPNLDDTTFSIQENSPNTTSVGTVTASDPDTSDTLTYAITAGNSDPDNDGNAAFAINNTTGEITVADGGDLDFEITPNFNLTVTATDAEGLSDDAAIAINLTDVNENTAPTITSNATFSVAENTTAVGTITATDTDGDNLSFTISDGVDKGLFTINDSGELSFNNAPDFENTSDSNGDNNYQVQVAVSDGTETVTQDLTISITNENEAPTVDDATFTVDENSTSGTEVGIITATDPENEAITYAIVLKDDASRIANGNIDSDGDNNLAFAIDSSTGTITVNDKDDLDFEVIPTFNLEVTATDPGSLTNTADITVNLNDVSPAVFDTESNNGIFTLNGGDSSNIKFTLANNNTEKVNEVGVFVVDDENGSIDGNAPGSDGYLQAALQRSQVILSAISDRPTGFDLGDIERVLEVDSDAPLGFYLVSNGTTDTALAELEESGTTSLPVFFSDSSNLEVSDLGTEGFKLNWSDEAGSTDFTNLDLSVQLTQDVPTPGTQLQGESQQELIDLTDVTGQVSVSVEVHREAAFDNLIGFYQVVDANGGIDINGDGIADFNPGDAGYEEAALTNRITGLDLLQTDNQQTSTIDGTFDGGSILASFIVVDGTVDEAINNNAEVYFSFLGANSDGVDHIRLLSDNTFGYEDLAGGGDFDYNDMIVKVDFPTV